MSGIAEIANKVGQASKDNPVIATIVGMYGLTVATYFLKDVPKQFVAFLKKHLTTSLSVCNSQGCYYQIMDILEKAKVADKSRSLKFLNGRWGNSSMVGKSILTCSSSVVSPSG